VCVQSLAGLVTKADLEVGRVYPPLTEIRPTSLKIAAHVAQFAYETGLAYRQPEPLDKSAYIQSLLYSTDYASYVPDVYDWPVSARYTHL
jgi:malic enzyme